MDGPFTANSKYSTLSLIEIRRHPIYVANNKD